MIEVPAIVCMVQIWLIMEAGVRLPLNMKYYELLSIYQYLKTAVFLH